MKEFRNPRGVHPPPGSYSHQIEIKGNERMLVLSGQVGMRPDGTVPGDPVEQMEVAFENVLRNLQAANMVIQDIIKLTYYLVGEIDAAKRRELVASRL
jgi:enamine deaminase RidA (YjgF/YER057c/UK114 family)